MTKFIYAVRDTVSGNLGDIATSGSDAEFVRAFRAQINNPGFPRYIARDLCVVCLGEYDDQAGCVSGYDSFRPVAYGSDLLEPERSADVCESQLPY